MIEPGDKTALQPNSALSPIIAPNFLRPVGIDWPSTPTTLIGVWSSFTFRE